MKIKHDNSKPWDAAKAVLRGNLEQYMPTSSNKKNIE